MEELRTRSCGHGTVQSLWRIQEKTNTKLKTCCKIVQDVPINLDEVSFDQYFDILSNTEYMSEKRLLIKVVN